MVLRYLFGNKFVFYVDHVALIYLVNKTWVSGRIVWWLLLFVKVDFSVVYKARKSQSIADAVSQNAAVETAFVITDVTTDAHLFNI